MHIRGFCYNDFKLNETNKETKMKFQDWLNNNVKGVKDIFTPFTPSCERIYHVIKCNDGFEMSVQASSFRYCEPRETFNDANTYDSFEVSFPNKTPEFIEMDGDVSGWVDADLIQKEIDFHGGIKVV